MQESGTWKDYSIAVGNLHSSSYHLSPVAHYMITRNTTISTLKCGSDAASRCHHRAQFQWSGDEACLGKMVCSVMDGNVCGDYGFIVKGPDSGDLYLGVVWVYIKGK